MTIKRMLGLTTALTLLTAPAFASDTAISTVDGIGNDVEILQSTAEFPVGGNDADVSIEGWNNDVFIDQESEFVGGGTASVTIDGAGSPAQERGRGNDVDIFQQAHGTATVDIFGDFNIVDIGQFNDDVANITIGGGGTSGFPEGDSNRLYVRQAFGALLNADIYGDGNNNPASGSFGGDAATVASAATPPGGLLGAGLQPGEIVQFGDGNEIDLDVGSTTLEASGNLFAFLQEGPGNYIDADIVGNGSQMAAEQVGMNNMAQLSQSGGDTIGSSQIGDSNSTTIIQN